MVGRFTLNVLILFDEALNTFTGGDPSETVSSRAAKAQANHRWWGCVLCKILDTMQKDHCKNSLLPTAGRDAIIPDGE